MGSERFDRVPLLFGPSPVHRLERLSEHLGGEVEIWAKREDCNSGLAYGGNKVRKLEYLVAEALAQGCDTLVSIGGVQSNHTRQVAAVAARSASAACSSRSTGSSGRTPSTTRSGTSCSRGSWARTCGSTRPGSTSGSARAGGRARVGRGKRRQAVRDPAGASDHPLGGLGFARWADEVAEQERELGVFFDTIVVCSVTGSTQAGMIAGFAAQEAERAVLGIDGSATVGRRGSRSRASRGSRRRRSSSDAISTTPRSSSSTSGMRAHTESPTRRRSTPSGCVRDSRVLTDPVYEGKSMAA